MRSRPNLVSVVMATYNGSRFLGAQLDSLAAQDYAGAWEVIVADNGSVDDSVAIVESYAGRLPGLRVIDASAGRGQGFARNTGVAAARGDYIVFCDQDDVADPGYVSGMVDGGMKFDLVTSTFDEESLNSELSIAWFSPPPRQTGPKLPRHLRFLPVLRGAGAGVWHDVFDALGGFDVTYVGGGEDCAFAWNAQVKSYTIGRAPDAIMAYRYRTKARAVYLQARALAILDPLLYRQFREHGLRRRSLARLIRAWASTVLFAPFAVVSKVRRGRWAKTTGINIGRLRGSAKWRVWYP